MLTLEGVLKEIVQKMLESVDRDGRSIFNRKDRRAINLEAVSRELTIAWVRIWDTWAFQNIHDQNHFLSKCLLSYYIEFARSLHRWKLEDIEKFARIFRERNSEYDLVIFQRLQDETTSLKEMAKLLLTRTTGSDSKEFDLKKLEVVLQEYRSFTERIGALLSPNDILNKLRNLSNE